VDTSAGQLRRLILPQRAAAGAYDVRKCTAVTLPSRRNVSSRRHWLPGVVGSWQRATHRPEVLQPPHLHTADETERRHKQHAARRLSKQARRVL